MREKRRCPAARKGANRATGLDFLGRFSNPQNSQLNRSAQDISSVAPPNDDVGPIAWVHIFVSRLGRVGYWIASCPICGHEHVHGGYSDPFDPRKRQGFPKYQVNLRGPRSLGWRVPHCHAWDAPAYYYHEYELMLAAGPARFAPGAARSRAAKMAMAYLRSIGVETSNDTIPSSWRGAQWRWL
jgi:hypothetical protein